MDSSENRPKPAAAEPATDAQAGKELTLAKFLESCAPDVWQSVGDLLEADFRGNLSLQAPEIELHCEICEGNRWFKPDDHKGIYASWEYKFLGYTCKNCGRKRKTFALAVVRDKEGLSGRVLKLGEFPPFGPPTPARLITLIGQDRDFFLKGRRAELRGLGIGAFAYYRRVVEEQKGRIIAAIGKVAQKVQPSKETAELFAKAKAETQFSTAIDMIKSAIPEALLIDGHNPLVLLHTALSEGLHAQTDAQCLELATSIRVVLAELAERISVVLKEEAGLKSAVSRLLNRL